MNTLVRHIPRLSVLLGALALLAPALRADEEGSTARAKFSDPAKPGTLKLSIPWAEARIEGTDGDEVVVTSSLDQKGENQVDDEGFRRLDSETTFELVEKDNVITLSVSGDNPWASHGADFEIKVPRNTNLVLRTQAGGDIHVEGVEGDLDINSMNGEVSLIDIASSAVVNTMNGEISATFKRAPTKPVSLSTMNGEIDVRLPADTKANLRMRTHNGSIRTNFPDSVLQTKTEKTSRSGGSHSHSANANANANANSDDAPAPAATPEALNREQAREQARLDREQAKMAREMAREAAQAAQEIVRAVADIKVEVNVDGIPMAPMAPLPPMPAFGGKTIVGALNGGGVDIKITSMNGAIVLRQAK